MSKSLEGKNLIYESDYFYLAPFSRLFLKTLSLAFFIVFGFLIAFMLLSGSERLIVVGILILIFYLDRMLHLYSWGHIPLRKDFSSLLDNQKKPLNIEPYFHPKTNDIITKSLNQAELQNNDLIEVYILMELLSHRLIDKALTRIGADSKQILKKISSLSLKNFKADNSSGPRAGDYFSGKVKNPLRLSLLNKIQIIALDAFKLAYAASGSAVEFYYLLPPLLTASPPELKKIFTDFNLNRDDVVTALNFEVFKGKVAKDHIQPLAFLSPRRIKKRLVNRAWTSKPTALLDKYSEDLTDLARSGKIGFLIGHDDPLNRLINVVSRQTRNNALLLGEAGVGKTSIAWHLAKRIIDDEVPPALFDKRLVILDIGSIVSGSQSAEIQEKINKIAEEILRAKNIILYIPDFHNLKMAGAPGQLSAYDILRPYFQSSTFQVIADSDPLSYEKYLTTDPDFMDTFEVVRVDEISEEEATLLLSLEGLLMENQYGILIQASAIKKVVNLAKRYLRPKVLPTSARDVLAEALEEAKRRSAKVLTEQNIVDLVERIVRIPIEQAKGAEASKLLDLENQLHQRLIDQEEAVSVVAQSLRQFRAGLSRKKGPIASFLFVGPTGVGKTELSKALAAIYFGSEDQMIRMDMSEYQLKESLQRFVGNRDGVAGTFAQAVKDKPYALILLDEFEKAHPDILNLFLAIFDDGRMTDALGRTVDFQNAIMISTSNAHSNLIKEEMDKGTSFDSIVESVKKRLTEYFKPELLNRFDAVVIFKPLGQKEILEIAKLQLKSLSKDLEKEQGITVSFDDLAVIQLAKEGFDQIFGARPLRRVIASRVRDTLANLILKKEISRGSRAVFKFKDGKFSVE